VKSGFVDFDYLCDKLTADGTLRLYPLRALFTYSGVSAWNQNGVDLFDEADLAMPGSFAVYDL
jgi:hypothetical protein